MYNYNENWEKELDINLEKIKKLKNMIKKQQDILGRKIHIGDKVAFPEPFGTKNNLNIGEVIKINKNSIIVKPLLFDVFKNIYIIKNMCIVVK